MLDVCIAGGRAVGLEWNNDHARAGLHAGGGAGEGLNVYDVHTADGVLKGSDHARAVACTLVQEQVSSVHFQCMHKCVLLVGVQLG